MYCDISFHSTSQHLSYKFYRFFAWIMYDCSPHITQYCPASFGMSQQIFRSVMSLCASFQPTQIYSSESNLMMWYDHIYINLPASSSTVFHAINLQEFSPCSVLSDHILVPKAAGSPTREDWETTWVIRNKCGCINQLPWALFWR